MELGKVNTTTKSGHESFHVDGNKTDHNLLSFWQWSSSEILGNALRGVLAEYIVSMDIKCPYEIREEWDAYDLITPENIKVEVKRVRKFNPGLARREIVVFHVVGAIMLVVIIRQAPNVLYPLL